MKLATIFVAAMTAALSLCVARAQIDLESYTETTQNGMVCSQAQATECAEVCNRAYRSFSETPPNGDAALIAECRALSAPVRIAAEAQEAAAASLAKAKQTARALIKSCRGNNRAACIAACRAAYETPADAGLLATCRESQPAPIVDPNAGLTFATRVANMDGYAAYCEAKKASGKLQRGDRRPLDGCIAACRNTHVTNENVPRQQQELVEARQ